MNSLIVYAHPEPKSFNAALRDAAADALREAGHEVVISDLYAEGFKAYADGADYAARANPDYLNLMAEGAAALHAGTFAADIKREQERLRNADFVLLQFPVWWFSMPSIMKGWVDRVFTLGFAFDFAAGRVYENGLLKGKKAMLSITTGGPGISYAPNGRAGDIMNVLWPIHSGILRFSGFDVLPPHISYGVIGAPDEQRKAYLGSLRERLLNLDNTEPLFFHAGNDYDETGIRLRPGVAAKTPAQRNE